MHIPTRPIIDPSADAPDTPSWAGAPESEEAAIQQALAIVAALRAAQGELAISTPGTQRLHIIATTAWMRALMTVAPASAAVESAARDAQQGCAVLAKRWWPGQLPILTQQAEPAVVGAAFSEGTTWTWASVAQQAERYLARLEPAPEAFQPLEWADASSAAAVAISDDIPAAQWVAKAHGAIEQVLRQRLDGPPPSWHERMASTRLDGDAWASLATAAAQLRHARTGVVSTRRWAEAMGRLRWLVFHRQHAEKHLQRWIDPAQMPLGGWSTLLGLGVDPRVAQQDRLKLLQDLQAEAASGGRLELMAWLRRAIDMDGEVLTVTELACLLADRAEEVFALQDRDLHLTEARASRRFKKLKRGLAKQGAQAGDPRVLLAGILARASLAGAQPVPPDQHRSTRLTYDDMQDGLVEHMPDEVDPARRLARLLGRHTDDRVALLVGRREEDAVCDGLAELTGMEVDAVGVVPEELESICEALGQGGYDFVIVATSSVGAYVTYRVQEALRSVEDAVFVRSYRPTVRSSLQGLARTLGAV